MEKVRVDGRFSLQEIIGWAATLVASAAVVVVFLYTTFQTINAAAGFQSALEQRLIRIETKIDALQKELRK